MPSVEIINVDHRHTQRNKITKNRTREVLNRSISDWKSCAKNTRRERAREYLWNENGETCKLQLLPYGRWTPNIPLTIQTVNVSEQKSTTRNNDDKLLLMLWLDATNVNYCCKETQKEKKKKKKHIHKINWSKMMQCYDYYYYYSLSKIRNPRRWFFKIFKNNNGSNCMECNFNHIAQWQWNSKLVLRSIWPQPTTERCRKMIIVFEFHIDRWSWYNHFIFENIFVSSTAVF